MGIYIQNKFIRKMYCLTALLFLMSGCSTFSEKQVEAVMSSAQKDKKILLVPFVKQKGNECGPTTLSMILEYTQTKAPPFDSIKKATMSPEANGTYKFDYLSAARRFGMATYKVPTVTDMIRQIDQGYPVVVFKDIGNFWFKNWHFEALVGYDVSSKHLIIHSDQTKNKYQRLSEFILQWKKGGGWSYAIVKPDVIPEQAEVEEALANAIVFERLRRDKEAEEVYRAIIARWPDRKEAVAGLANTLAKQGYVNKARDLYEQLNKEFPENLHFKKNLSYLRKLSFENEI